MCFAAGGRQQLGAIPGGGFKSNLVSPELGGEEKEDITNEKADLAFCYVLLIAYRQPCLFINLPGKSICLSHSSGLCSTLCSSTHLSIQ